MSLTIRTLPSLPSASGRGPRQKTRSSSLHKISRPLSASARTGEETFICQAPISLATRLERGAQGLYVAVDQRHNNSKKSGEG